MSIYYRVLKANIKKWDYPTSEKLLDHKLTVMLASKNINRRFRLAFIKLFLFRKVNRYLVDHDYSYKTATLLHFLGLSETFWGVVYVVHYPYLWDLVPSFIYLNFGTYMWVFSPLQQQTHYFILQWISERGVAHTHTLRTASSESLLHVLSELEFISWNNYILK